MSKVQQGFECAAAAAATARRARDENMKPLLQSHFHIKSKHPKGGEGGTDSQYAAASTVVYYAYG